MPLPEPKPHETKEAFVSRCIETLTKYDAEKFPSREQRAAVCYSQWGETPAEKQAYEKSRPDETSRKSGGGKSKK